VLSTGLHDINLQPKGPRPGLQLSHQESGGWTGRIDQERYQGRRRDDRVQHFQQFRHQLHTQLRHARNISARPGEARHKSARHRVDTGLKHYRNLAGRRLCGPCLGKSTGRCNHVHLATDQIGRQRRQSIVLIVGPAIFNGDILPLDIAGFDQTLQKPV
jgi:hypothetical protein